MKRVISAALVAVMALGTLVACGPSSSGASGEVVERDTTRVKARTRYVITVKEDGGKRDSGHVSRETYENCQVGDRWPDCKKK